ncbi:hypothetical protein [Leptotrichia sp. oral taxon 221]|jgi:hypothetical protein|uniref:hypothetical protein n=1 Tax=Leptotrichia sp. oral taxon 221 TaxID=712362 RepID=UPI002013BA0B|nr:hypothetical protein [Leptotrichia sp. oral taxon 221]
MNGVNQWIENNKGIILKVLIILGIIFCIFGVMNVIFENTIFNLLKNLTKPYLDKTYDESKKLFLVLSLIKGTTDVIEGSTVNVSMILGMEIEVGDIVQPIYDIINILWKISLASTVILKLESLYFEIFKVKIANLLIFISLVSLLPYTFIKNKVTSIFKSISKYSFFILVFIYLVLPGSLLINSYISRYFEEEYKKPAIEKLDKSLDKLNEVKDRLFTFEQSKSIFDVPGQITSTKEKVEDFNKEIVSVSKSLSENTPLIIGIMLLTTIILPILIILFLYKVTRIMIIKKIEGN